MTTEFEQPIYDQNSKAGIPYWLPLAEGINVAFTNSTFGGGIASQSGDHSAQYGADRAIDGDHNTLAHGYAGSGIGENSPWWQVRLHQQVNVKTVKVYNRYVGLGGKLFTEWVCSMQQCRRPFCVSLPLRLLRLVLLPEWFHNP